MPPEKESPPKMSQPFRRKENYEGDTTSGGPHPGHTAMVHG